MQANTNQSPQLVGKERCLEILFPHADSRPGMRTFNEWLARGYVPKFKIGKRVFIDPDEARRALERRFRINAIQP